MNQKSLVVSKTPEIKSLRVPFPGGVGNWFVIYMWGSQVGSVTLAQS